MGIDGCASGGLVHWSSNFQPTGQCEQAPRMNRSGRETWLQRRCVVQNQGGLESQVPGGFGSSTGENVDSQPERFFSTREILLKPRDCSQPEKLFSTKEIVLLIAKRKQKYLSKTKTAKEEQPTIKRSTRNQWTSVQQLDHLFYAIIWQLCIGWRGKLKLSRPAILLSSIWLVKVLVKLIPPHSWCLS